MFDRQLTIDGREEDIAPQHEQPRMFDFPKTMKGQTSLADIAKELGVSKQRVQQISEGK